MALAGNKQALVIVFALALITVLYVKTEAVTPETHTWIVNHLREIEHQEALLNQDILKARSGLLPHVDSLVAGIRRVSILIGETREAIHRMFGAGDHEIAPALKAMAEQFANRVSVIEDFKSDNAVLRNSLGYLTVFVVEISSNIRSTGNNDALAEEIENLRLEILDYYISGDSAQRLNVESRIQRLANLADDLPSLAQPLPNVRQQAFEIRPLLAHANVVLYYRDRVKSQVENILSISSSKSIKDIQRIVNERYENILTGTNKYRLLLYAVSIALLCYVAFILIRLRRGSLALRKSEERFRYTFENAPVGLALITLEGKRFKVNKALADFLGYSVEEITDTTMESTAADHDDLDKSLRLRQRVLDGEITTYRNERRYRHKQGHIVWGEVSSSLLRNEDGEPEHFIAHTIDITERKRAEGNLLKVRNELETRVEERTRELTDEIAERKGAEAELRNAKNEAEIANRAKSEFLSAMSHELRSPLNAILGFADIISHQHFGSTSEKYKEYAEDIQSSGEHLLTLINEILDLSTIEAGKQPLVKEKLSIKGIVGECVRIVEEKARSNGIDLVVKVPKDLPPLYADRRAAKQILLNLLSNAVKFTSEGGKITVSAKASKRNTTLKIADTGKGIPAEKLPKLTDPFTRAETNPHLAEPGWGLGLAITKSLVDLHGGTLDITSKVGKGTTVTVTLPNGAP